MNAMQHTKKHEDLIYDVGMHKGEDTDYYLKKGFRVIGFEADPDLATQCRSRFSNEIEKGNLIIVEGAVTEPLSEEGNERTIKFYRNKDKSIWGTIVDDWAHRNEYLGTSNEIIDVTVVDFSECLKKYGIPHYLKIDIEGKDTVCLRALLNFMQKPNYISIESDKVSFQKLVGELDLLEQLGYTKFKAIEQNSVPLQKEPHISKEGSYVGYKFQIGASGLFGNDLPLPWQNYFKILNEYKFIFLQYMLFGDYGKLNKYQMGMKFKKFLSKCLRKPIPGWYDTHAKHSSIV